MIDLDKPFQVCYHAVYFGKARERQTAFEDLELAVKFAEKVADEGYLPVYITDRFTGNVLYDV
jgi:hypothetical protein